MVELRRADLPRVPVDHAEVDAPDEVGGVVRRQLPRRPAARERDGRRLQPVGRRVGDPLLKERLGGGAVREPLEHGRAVAQLVEHRLGEPQVVVDQPALGDPRLREDQLVRTGDPDLAPTGLDQLVLGRHRLQRMPDTARVSPIPGVRETVLVAPDSFKGTFTATEVAEAVGAGLQEAGRPVDLCPVADGGEGTLEALRPAFGGELRSVAGPRAARAAAGRVVSAVGGWPDRDRRDRVRVRSGVGAALASVTRSRRRRRAPAS